MMNLKQKISICGFSKIFCCPALYFAVLCTFVGLVFEIERGRKRLSDHLFGLFSFGEHSIVTSILCVRNLSVVFSIFFFFTSFFNGQTVVPRNVSVFYITQGTIVYGKTSLNINEKPEISHIVKKEIVKNKPSKVYRNNVFNDAVAKKKVALELPKGKFDEAIYRKDSKSESHFVNSTFKVNCCAIVCASSLYKFIGQNLLIYLDFQVAKEALLCRLKIQFLSCTAFFLSEHFSYQFFGTSPPLSLG